MKVDGVSWRPIQLAADGWRVTIIDQTRLPHRFETVDLETLDEAAHAIRAMLVRGAPLIGATAAYGVALAMRQDPSDTHLAHAIETLRQTRPTAVNLFWALERVRAALHNRAPADRAAAAYAAAAEIAEEDVGICEAIGDNGLEIIRAIAAKKPGETVNILTHCNAGWLATVDWGTALAPIYKAHDAGIDVHVWVDETRPRNQGASLTAWELGAHGVPMTVVVDNAGGHLMQHGQVDMVITGTDRTTRTGDVCNKIGTYLKALAAKDNGVPFYVGLPGPTIDWAVRDGVADIPIEERSGDEVGRIAGRTDDGEVVTVTLTPEGARSGNPAFDVTPARLVTGLITERGVCEASEAGLLGLYPEKADG
ncbi:MAG: S-methyl-5-thioribose-1-phosphate isomerase [Minwuia sp.]|uniref:S-methyl-5-thioribose-1-phosphate isomerase n=1 Tax=Minwuia sp. TaxID=2493630 RepID=UPI003A89167E